VLALALAGSVCGLPATAHSASAAPTRTVVVTGTGDAAAAVRATGGTVLRSLPLVHGVVARLSAPGLPGFEVTPDQALTVTGKRDSSGGGGEVTARAALGLGAPAGQGAGVTVAVVDTGVADVPELAGRVEHVDVTGTGTGDGYGHGTFVATLVAGATLGVAPGASVLDVRVGAADGSTSLVDVMLGLQAVSEHPEVGVVNLSLSADGEVPPLTDALEALWAQGDTVVVPAGNVGPDRDTVTSPGTDPVLLTAGALDGDTVADWSSRGGNGVQKPDLVAPGAHVLSAAAPGSVLWDEHPDARRSGDRFVGSGTSFSTALVSGAAAVLLAERPALTPYQVKTVFTQSASRVQGSRLAVGAGGLDVADALLARTPKDLSQDGSAGDGIGTDASSWAASSWAARQWSARQWSARQWSARQWSARQWSARQWSAAAWE
jgi:serine protease AprX